MRLALILSLLATPAFAWQVTEGPVCTLSHTDGATEIVLTHDPALPLYSITVSRPAPWPESRFFAIRFEGPQPNEIGTNRHVLTHEGRSLTVTDRGFGNVLDGMQFNDSFTAVIGDQVLSVSLDGAAEPVAVFRACTGDVPAV